MRNRIILACLVPFAVGIPASAAELTLSIVQQTTGASAVTVTAGTTVNYEIRGLLSSSADNEGLAFWSADLAFGGSAALANHTPGAAPSTTPMSNFVKDAGFTNPAGYGGTTIGTGLAQLGGGQNTIGSNATHAPYPIGTVAQGVAHTTYQVLATGSYTVPMGAPAGSQYTLMLTRPLASVINAGDITSPYDTHAIKVNLSPATLTIGTPPNATVVSAVSRKANVSGPGGYCDLVLTGGVKTEPRDSRITEVRITFDTAPGIPSGGSGVSIQEKTCPAPGTYAAYTGASTSSASVSGNVLALTFTPALENARTYKISLASPITVAAAQAVEIRSLVADVDDNGSVNATDRSEIVSVWTGSGFSCKTDLNSSGGTNANDRSIWVNADTSPESQQCAP